MMSTKVTQSTTGLLHMFLIPAMSKLEYFVYGKVY